MAIRIARTTMADAVSDQLRALVVSGELPLGTPLRQDDLAERLGVSRTPLREAINRLVAEGLVTSDPHRGAVVARLSAQELRETYEIREVLEVLAGRIAAEHRTDDDVRGLTAILAEFEATGSVEEWAQLNTRFHMTMYAVSRRTELCTLIERMRNRAELFVRVLVASPGRSQRAEQDHLRILAAFAARDADATEIEIRNHLRVTVDSVAAVLAGRDDDRPTAAREDSP